MVPNSAWRIVPNLFSPGPIIRPSAVVIAPVVEELFFRGLLHTQYEPVILIWIFL